MSEPPRKRKFAERKVRDDWLEIDIFKPWISRVEGDDTKVFCKTCKKMLKAGISGLKRHVVSTRNIHFIK